MDESGDRNSLSSSETQDSLKSGKVKYEEWSKEELIKQVKKQLAFLQKFKNKCDALTKENGQYREELELVKEAACENKETHCKITELYGKYFPPDCLKSEEIQTASLLEEIDKEFLKLKEKETKIQVLEEQLSMIQKDKESIAVSFREAEEQVQCMKMKLETLTMTCQCLQGDLTKCLELNKQLNDEVDILRAARDTAMQSIASVKAKVNKNNSLEMENLKLEVEQLKDLEKKLRTELLDCHKLNTNLQQELSVLVKSKVEQEKENAILLEKCKCVTEENDAWKLQLEEYETEKMKFSSCSEKVCMLQQENEAYKTQNSEFQKHMEELEEEKLKLREQLQSEKSLFNEFNCQIEILISSIKQGVKQKNASNKFKTENKPMQNISILRVLYDELSSQLKNHIMRTNYLETEIESIMQQKQKVEEELIQLVDLKQFLEDEAKSLVEENGQLKNILSNSRTESENDQDIIAQLQRELQESIQREQELLNELNNYSIYDQERICPLDECDLNRISPKNIPETIMEELQEDEIAVSEDIGADSTAIRNNENEENEAKLKCMYDVSCDSSSSDRNTQDSSAQTIRYVSDVSTQVVRILCDSSTETGIDYKEFGVQATIAKCDVCVGEGVSSETSVCAETMSSNNSMEAVCALGKREVDVFDKCVGESNDFMDKLSETSVGYKKIMCDASTEIESSFFPIEVDEHKTFDLIPHVRNSTSSVDVIDEHEIIGASEVKPKEVGLVPQELLEELNRTKNLLEDLEHRNDILEKDIAVAQDQCQIHISELQSKSKSIEELNEALESKSKLVESIHCQMDSLLTKVEELGEEVKIKDCDLDTAGKKMLHLESMLKDLNNLNKGNKNILSTVNSVVFSLRESRDNMSVEVNKLQRDCITMFHNTNSVVSDLRAQLNNFYSAVECHKQETVELKDEISNLKETLVEVEQELGSVLDVLKNAYSEKYLIFNHSLVHAKSDSKEVISNETPDLSNEQTLKICLNETPDASRRFSESSCTISEKQKIIHQIKLLHRELQKVLDLINQLATNNDKAVKEINNYKIQIIPNLERTVSDLQLKLQEQSSGSNEEIEKLNSFQQSLCEAECAQSTPDESISLLQKKAEAAEIKMNKFKLVAIKVKKELAETKKLYQEVLSEKGKSEKLVLEMTHELDKLSKENHQHVRNFQSLQTEYDKLQDECEELKATLKTLEGDLVTLVAELNGSKQKFLDLEAEYEKSKGVLSAVTIEKQAEEKKSTALESKVIILESKYDEKQKRIDDLECELSKLKNRITEIEEDRDLVKQKLGDALKEGKKHSLLDLEMADYERTVSELNLQLQEKTEEISELQSDVEGLNTRVNCLQEEISHCENQRITEEKRADNLKDILEKTKEELTVVRNHEQELSKVVIDLKSQMELITQQGEEYKIQLAKKSAEAQQLKQSLVTSAESHKKIVKCLEAKNESLCEEVLLAHKEAENKTQEFENYKIRVHSVLKQQKHSASGFTPSDVEVKEELQKLNEKLKLQLTDLSEKFRACTLENESTREEHEHLLLRYSKIVDDLEAKSKSWSQKLEQVNSDKKILEAAQEELISQHALQHSMLTTSFVKQIKDLQEQHKQELKELQKQLEVADIEIAHLQREQLNTSGVPSTPSGHDEPFPFDICSQERQEGEGSECTEGRSTPIKLMSLATIPTSGFLPLEKLLQSPIPPDTPKSFISNQDSEKLSSDLNVSNKKIDHLSELLNESEANNLRLNEQVRVLKEEVRRLERNKEREQHAENLEYLKNIFVKFITLQSGDEKSRLIPVLTTMLKLSPLEQQQLKLVAGESGEADASSGWGTYLHRWSGLM